MKTRTILFLSLLLSTAAFGQSNKAVKLDGVDNYLPIGMGMLIDKWTVEAWIKGDGDKWNDLEAIIAGGYYAKQNTSDDLALVIKNGRLHNNGANISSPAILPTAKWLHVAAMSDGKNTSLYINGDKVATRDTSITIIPGAIGANEGKESLFGGMIDEVRIWKTALSATELKDWMNQSITPAHPKFSQLHGHYTFDDFSSDMSINRVAKGHLPYHVRNDRVDYYGERPLASLVENDNSNFTTYTGNQALFTATVIASEWDSDLGTNDEQILKLRIIVDGESNPLSVDKISLDLSKCSDLKDISKLNLYYTGTVPRSQVKEAICKPITKIKKKLTVKLNKGIKLNPGVNYFLLAADISPTAKPGNRIKITVPTLSLSKNKITPIPDESSLDKFISMNSKADKSILKVIQWNIWHGGVHVGGKTGRLRIIDLIKSSNADVVMMQEAYGAQEQIADSLNFEMTSASSNDNLALYSRYPLEKIATKNPFYSNPAYITLPSNKKILFDNIWIRYAYRPAYTDEYCSLGYDTEVWCKEDSILGLKDVQRNLLEDVNPYHKPGMDIIFGGDFNSGSHLDWTKRAAHLHNGYVVEKLPISRYMYEQGYIDTYRALKPDEVLHPGGTYAPILGHKQTSRIDYIYYKGDGIRPIFSKIIRTAYDIDDVWAGDHAAVLTTFKVKE